MLVRLALPVLLGCAVAGAASAHPHIYIETDFALVFDAEGRLTAVDIEWTYDDFYSLLLVEENGLDTDGDGIPEPARLAEFAGNDVDWAAGFPGDFTVTVDGTPVELLAPESHSAGWSEDQYVTRHVQALAEPVQVDEHEIVARSYDPTYFVAYDVTTDPRIEGRDDCTLARDAADREAARKEYGETLSALDQTADPFAEIDLPDVGILFADAFALSCDAGA